MYENLLKKCIATALIIFIAEFGNTFAQEIEFKINPNNLPDCPEPRAAANAGERISHWDKCWGKYVIDGDGMVNDMAVISGEIYLGEYKNGLLDGFGIYTAINEDRYIGQFKNGKKNGKGVYKFAYGRKRYGIWQDGIMLQEKNNLDESNESNQLSNIKSELSLFDKLRNNFEDNKNVILKGVDNLRGIQETNKNIIVDTENKNNSDSKKFDLERQQLLEKRRRLELDNYAKGQARENERQQISIDRSKLDEEKRNRTQARNTQRLNLQITNTQPNTIGEFTVSIKTNSDTASLKLNGEEQGGKEDGSYTIRRIARAGQITQLVVFAEDVYGNTDTKTISVNRNIATSNLVQYPELNPSQIKMYPSKDAVAIIIGIADYKNLPRADYANDDARAFYDYAIRGLGVRAENIKLLVDAEADEIEILRTFKTWLPARVKATTDVYVYYSGHGLPTDDGTGLYLLPQRADSDFLSDTALQQERINQALQDTKPKSVTIFLDSCYSGMARTGQTLLASARPITLKATAQTFPAGFTVISASSAKQISSSSNELKHGIFSYYLMKGMEGDADVNKDGKITVGEMHRYLSENVARQASLTNRVQNPQLTGDANRTLVGR